MMHLLEQRISKLRRQAWSIIVFHGLFRLLTVALGALIVGVLVDFICHLEDHGLRMMLSLTVLGAIGYFAGQVLLGIWRPGWTSLQVAQRVEGHFPALRDRLSSALSFLAVAPSDGAAGSSAMRSAVIDQAGAELSDLDLSQVLDGHSAKLAARWGGALALLALALTAMFPMWAKVGLTRLCNPLGGPRWPQVNQLVIKSAPERIALGDPFEISVMDQGGRLPSEVRLHWRFAESNSSEVEPMRRLDNEMFAHKEGITRNFTYRVEGGDDQSMPWREVAVVEPASVEELTIRVHPPDYTGWPIADSPRSFHALAGSRIEVSGTATKPLAQVELVQEDGFTAPAIVGEKQFQLAADAAPNWIATRSQNYWLKLTDTLQLTGGAGQRWEMRVAPDNPPQVTLDEPASDLYVTPDGKVDLAVVVKDDLAVHAIELSVHKLDETGQTTEEKPLSLWHGETNVAPTTEAVEPGTQEPDVQRVEQSWDLTNLSLQPGMQLTVMAVASDYKPQSGNSSPRRLHVVRAEELEQRLTQRMAGIAGELERAMQLQQDVRARAEELGIQWRQVPTLRRQDLDQVQAIQLSQKQVSRTLTGRDEGISSAVRGVLRDLDNNQIDNPAMRRQLDAVQGELSRLGKDELQPLGAELNGLAKESQAEMSAASDKEQGVPAPPALQQSLARATQSQSRIERALETMLGQLQDVGSARRFAQELGDIRQAQKGLESDLKQEAASTLGKEPSQLSPQERADLGKQSARQQTLAQRLERAMEQMRSAAHTAESEDPLGAAAFKETTELAQERGVSGQMRGIADDVRNNQIGQARQKQEDVLRSLDEMLDSLSNRREHELTRLASKLREAEQELSKMRGEQSERAAQMSKNSEGSASNQGPNSAEKKQELQRLAKQQAESREQTKRLAKRLERLSADNAAQNARAAAQRMGSSGEESSAGNQDRAAQQAAQAQADLQEAQRQVARRRKQVEAQLAEETVRQMDTLLAGLRDRQDRVLHDTTELETARAKSGTLKRTQFVQVNQLTGEQRSLARETSELVKRLVDKEIFQWTLRDAAKSMEDAGNQLASKDLGKGTQQAESSARDRIVMTLEAMQQDKKQVERKPPQNQQGGEGNGEGGEKANAQPRRRTLNPSEIKLLSLMQTDINQRFVKLAAEPPSPEQQKRRQSLADELGQLAEMTERLARGSDESVDNKDLPELDLEPKTGGSQP